MKNFRMEPMVKGWFVGAFAPTALATDACEVAVKTSKAGDTEAAHYHKIATEVTLILSGRVRMSGKEYNANDIVVVEPNEIVPFECLEDATMVVVKVPGALNDKYRTE